MIGDILADVLRWTLYAPFYDRLISFLPQRRRSIERLDLKPGERVLVAGCGTGLDLPLLPAGVEATAIDLTPAMVKRARRRAPGMDVRVMDAEKLEFADGVFDAVVLHLIVAIVPHPLECLREARRVLTRNGRACVFDKFAQGPPSLLRRGLNIPARVFGTDINCNLHALADAAGFRVEHDEPAMMGGVFRTVLLRPIDPE